jgi:hypothetical protein
MKKLKMEDMIKPEDQEYQTMVTPEDIDISDKISLKAIEELLNIKKLKTISRIKFEQVPILSKLYMFTEIFGEKYTKNLADQILQLQISVSGLGRRELVQLVQQRSEMMEIPQQKVHKDIFR